MFGAHRLYKTWNEALLRRSRVVTAWMTAKKCTKKREHVQSCCIANLNLLLFWRSRCHFRRLCSTSLVKTSSSIVFNLSSYRYLTSVRSLSLCFLQMNSFNLNKSIRREYKGFLLRLACKNGPSNKLVSMPFRHWTENCSESDQRIWNSQLPF